MSGIKSGTWHPAAYQLAKLVLIELDFYKHLFFIPSNKTSLAAGVYHDWVVHMAWDGCREWKGWWVSDEGKIDVITKRSAAFKRKVTRFATAAGIDRESHGDKSASDMYFTAVAVLVDDGVVTKWVRRRDVRGRNRAQAAEWGFISGSDCYWYGKLRAGPLGPSGTTLMDPHSGLTVPHQLEILRRTRFVGFDSMPQSDWSVHRNYAALQDMVTSVCVKWCDSAARIWIVIMVDIACGRMTTDDAILSDERLQLLVHGSDALPSGAGGISSEQLEVLTEMRDGARMYRPWPEREYRDVTPTNSRYRVVEIEETMEWKLKARWKVIKHNQTEAQLAVASIGAREEQPDNSAAYKPAVLPRMVREVDDSESGPGSYMFTCRCIEGGPELKAAKQWTDSPVADTVPVLICGNTQDGDVVSDTCGGFHPPIGGRGAFAHEHDVAAFRPRPNRGSENLYGVGTHSQVAFVVAHHDGLTEAQRARMINVDICAGSQSQKAAMLMLNVATVSFDLRTEVDSHGTILTNHWIDATAPLYDTIARTLHGEGIAMCRIATVTLSSNCATTGTTNVGAYRPASGKPKSTANGKVAAAADMTILRWLQFLKRLRQERRRSRSITAK